MLYNEHVDYPPDKIHKQSSQTREVWLDCCRVICIFSIIYGHAVEPLKLSSSSPWTGLIMGPFFDASAPCTVVLLYFFLSGWLQKVREKYLAWKHFFFLIIPLLLWNIVQIALTWHSDIHTFSKAITEIGIWPTFHNANYPLWFLDELAWLSLFLPIIHRLSLKIRALFIIIALWAGNLYWPESWWIPKEANTLSFFLMGTMLHSVKMDNIRQFFMDYAWLPTFLILAYLTHGLILPCHFSLPHMHISPLYSVTGCICILSYGATIQRFFPRLANRIASYAPAVFFMYAAHIPAFTLYSILAKQFGIPELPPIYHPLYTLLFCITSIIIFKAALKIGNIQLLSWVFLYKMKR